MFCAIHPYSSGPGTSRVLSYGTSNFEWWRQTAACDFAFPPISLLGGVALMHVTQSPDAFEVAYTCLIHILPFHYLLKWINLAPLGPAFPVPFHHMSVSRFEFTLMMMYSENTLLLYCCIGFSFPIRFGSVFEKITNGPKETVHLNGQSLAQREKIPHKKMNVQILLRRLIARKDVN